MRLDMLLARERFTEVLSTTLSNYLRHRFGWEGEITWGNSSVSARDLLINAKLNLIFPASFDTDALRQLAAEYSFHPNWVRRTIQRAYVRYTVARPFRRIFSSAHIKVLPWPEEVSNWCILPGNHSIRIVDIFHDECIVLAKVGFNQKLMESLVRLRYEFPDLPSPRLLEANLQEGWYREQRIRGLPLNRICDLGDAMKTLLTARSAMAKLYRQTLKQEPVNKWLSDRLLQVNSLVEKLPPIYSAESREEVVNYANWLKKNIVFQFHDSDGVNILTAQTHGDFQPANILMPKTEVGESLYLIDWEYSTRRCVWYDALVFDLQSRFPVGLASRIRVWLNNVAKQRETLAWCEGEAAGWTSQSYVWAFLLDDLLLRLTDTTIPGLRTVDAGFTSFMHELSQLKREMV